MLEYVRRRARSTWIKVTFVIIVLVFIFWGIGGSVGGGRTDVVAKVDGQGISTESFSVPTKTSRPRTVTSTRID